MKPATLNQLKAELSTRSDDALIEIFIRLAKYKKDNKELITYLLFEADDEAEYIRAVKDETDLSFADMNMSNVYLVKKSLRKILRNINKYIRYSGIKQTEIELLIYFCNKIRETGIDIEKSIVLTNMYDRLLEKIGKAIMSLHEDRQADFRYEYEKLSEEISK